MTFLIAWASEAAALRRAASRRSRRLKSEAERLDLKIVAISRFSILMAWAVRGAEELRSEAEDIRDGLWGIGVGTWFGEGYGEGEAGANGVCFGGAIEDLAVG